MITQRILKGESKIRHNVENSIFWGLGRSVTKRSEVGAFLAEIKAQYPDATHITYAYYLPAAGLTYCSDDGEPSGSAGRVILNEIMAQQLENVIVVVIRYFGRHKLGLKRLTAAYRACASALIAADLIEAEPCYLYMLTLADPREAAQMLKNLARSPAQIVSKINQNEGLVVTFKLPVDEMPPTAAVLVSPDLIY